MQLHKPAVEKSLSEEVDVATQMSPEAWCPSMPSQKLAAQPTLCLRVANFVEKFQRLERTAIHDIQEGIACL